MTIVKCQLPCIKLIYLINYGVIVLHINNKFLEICIPDDNHSNVFDVIKDCLATLNLTATVTNGELYTNKKLVKCTIITIYYNTFDSINNLTIGEFISYLLKELNNFIGSYSVFLNGSRYTEKSEL